MSDQYRSSADHVPHAPAHDDKPYPPYYYLWHLCVLGVLRAERVDGSPCPDIVGSVWDDLDADHGSEAHHPTTIAMIDVGVGHHHPNLMQVDMNRAIDLVTHRYGARRVRIDTNGDLKPEKELPFFRDLKIEGLDLDLFSEDEKTALISFADKLRASNGVLHMTETLDAALPSHGTAVAGLAVGDPGLVHMAGGRMVEPVSLHDFVERPDGRSLRIRDNVVPYVGVDPFSTLVPIKTSFDEDPWPLMAALLYAYQIGSDVILLPRDIPDPTRGILTVTKAQNAQECRNDSPSGTTRRDSGTAPDEWTILKKLLIAVSKKIPIVCAAGNSGESQLIYPACLAGEKEPDGRESNGIIAVGAVNADGRRAGYSNYGMGLTVVAPSNDGEIYNEHQARIDWGNPATKLHPYGLGSHREIPYSHYTIATTDLPGAWGYAGGSVPYVANLPPENNPGFAGGYYTGFGGTSAAAGLTAGVVALMSRAHKARAGRDARLTGIEAKMILMRAANMRPDRLQSGGGGKSRGSAFEPDPMNGQAEAKADPKVFFGAGLVDAAEAVRTVKQSAGA
ncbi:S8 family serine peptidase [Microvirga yunnanensis]|uniref:S8 family serine peptidase n=1 Tax=Microvirga yunnanensis TaxID=2953740 RepID=UPI0021CA7C91|nr:S8 family serine peptidase [Microvirga sp. HBU65207]